MLGTMRDCAMMDDETGFVSGLQWHLRALAAVVDAHAHVYHWALFAHTENMPFLESRVDL